MVSKFQYALLKFHNKMKIAKSQMKGLSNNKKPKVNPWNRNLPLEFIFKGNGKDCIERFQYKQSRYYLYPYNIRIKDDNFQSIKLFEFNSLSKNSKYLRRVYQMIQSCTRINSTEIIKEIKAIRAPKAKSWEETFSKKEKRWALNRLDDLSFGYDCVDNYRAAKFGKTSHMRRYKRYKRNGCCGSFDTIEVGPNGKKYLLGFNYGH